MRLQERYESMKAAVGKDVVCLFRLGEFYEAFNEDAEIISRVTGLTLTRAVTDRNMQTAGFPRWHLDRSLEKLKAAGHRYAIEHEIVSGD